MKGIIRYFINHRVVVYFLISVMFFGGIASFFSLGQLEDPVFTIKTATIITKYPGASPKEVEQEVTDKLEQALQEMPQLKKLYSLSTAGESYIKVDIKDQYWSDKLPQIWDELRKKVRDVTPKLPPGVKTPIVGDDFGFVYGFFLALTGDGFSERELEQYADSIKKELSLVEGVTRIALWGVQPQVIYVDLSEQKLKELGVSGDTIIQQLQEQNIVVNAGSTDVNTERLRIAPTGEFTTPAEIGELKITPSSADLIDQFLAPTATFQGPSDDSLSQMEQRIDNISQNSSNILRLSDIATIRRGYLEPPVMMMRYNGAPAIGIAIAGADDENIVTVGERIDRQIAILTNILPVGIELNKIAWQSDVVDESVQSFLINLIEAVVIVLVVLIVPSGFKMGFIIGFDLVITILATFIFMAVQDIPLQRMSLGALIIALGMMVDNAIVVSDSIAVKLRQGMDRVEAAVEAASSSAYPLFAATVVAVMAFYPIAASTAGAGEYTQTLFTVVGVSLLLSWFIAMVVTPVQCIDMLPDPDPDKEGGEFDSAFFRFFRSLLKKLIKVRFLTFGCLAALLVVSVYFFGFVEQMFFPDSSRPQLMIDYWTPRGTRIEDVAAAAERIQKKVQQDPNVLSVSTFVGGGPPRFYLPVDPEKPQSNYAQLIINFPDYTMIQSFIDTYKPWATEQFPSAMVRFRRYGVGPSNTWPFEARISGPASATLEELRLLGKEVLEIGRESPYGTDWRTDMLNRTLKVVPVYDQKRARLASITRRDLANAIRRGYDGVDIGLYREKDKLLPIVARNREGERVDFLDRLALMQVQPQGSINTVPAAQAVSDFKMEWEDPIIVRYNRRRSITVQGAPVAGETFPTLRKDVIKEVDALSLPPGYKLTWHGEQESTVEAQESLIPGLIPAVVIILFMIVTVFNAMRPLFIILITIPFAAIGITWGLLLLQTPFGFLALLGAMSLAGMMNKNIVVLLDACNENLASGMSRYEAIIEASVTRVRPVILAAGTTVLGVIPLIQDVFWTAMAVTIMAGLAFGSILTLVLVPVLYSIFYRVREKEVPHAP